MKNISYQVIRVEKFGKKDLSGIGKECERKSSHNRNEDIDDMRSKDNIFIKKSEEGFISTWKYIVKETNATFKDTKASTAFEGIVITSDKKFFSDLGYVQGECPPQKVLDFFDKSYKFVLKEIGYHGTDKNIISAVVHLDETTPHLQLYYIPLVDKGKQKVYATGEDGKVLRNEKGSPIQAKDKNGKSIYKDIDLEVPKVCSTDFWDLRGGQNSFGNLQDAFYENVSSYFGLERGEIGSNKKHTTKYQWEMQRHQKEIDSIKAEKSALSEEIEPLKDTFEKIRNLFESKRHLPRKELERCVVSTLLEIDSLKKDNQLKLKDNEFLYNEMRKLEKQMPELKENKQYIDFIKKYAGSELKEIYDIARFRQREMSKPKFHTNENYFSK